jgi:hypothetical protein
VFVVAIARDSVWEALLAVLGALAIPGAGVGFLLLAKWFSRKDVAWLSEVMRTAMGMPAEDAVTSRRSTLSP